MDLSRLVSVGLFPARRAPLTSAEQSYFAEHGLEGFLAELTGQLAAAKPADPYKFIAEAAASMSPPVAGAKAAAKQPPVKAVCPAPPQAKAKSAAAAAEPAKAAAAAAAPAPPVALDEAKIKEVGDAIRARKEALKKEGLASKQINEDAEVKKLVAELQALKSGGGSAPAAPAPEAKPKGKAEPAKPKEKAKAKAKAEAKAEALAKQPEKGGGVDIRKIDDVPGWYEQVIMKSELIEQYPVKGCFILRPWAYRMWEVIQGWFDAEIKKLGVENCYFPMFIPRCYIEKEEDHLNDFAPELAWVSKFGNSDIDEPVAIRPTSETAMYAAYSNWVQSHRDLPIKLNQWCSVVRWEVKQTTPFLRTREFLWQEGHTAHAIKEQAEQEVMDILELYAGVYERLLALPVVRGRKTKAETFPGADYTTTVEAFVPATGRAIQGATSHHLGQNFSKMFDISFQDPKDSTGKARDHAYQNSWGITQRTIGVMVMVHGDDKGLVMPPMVAALQVVIVAVGISAKSTAEEKQELDSTCMNFYISLKSAGVRVKLDERDYSPGWKFNYWEMKGVPLRIELGPKDIRKGTFVMAKRNILDPKAGKVDGKIASVVEDVQKCLDEIQTELYAKALHERDSRLHSVDKWEDFGPALNKGCLCLVPFCGDPECEEKIKAKTKEEAEFAEVAGGLKMGAKSLCIPVEDKYNENCPPRCILPECMSKTPVTRRTLFGRSY